MNHRLTLLLFLSLTLTSIGAQAAREPVLKQIELPHSYYYREMFLPQLTSGPSSVDFSPDGASLVYSMAGSLWRQEIGTRAAIELTHGPGYDYQPDWSPDGRFIVFARHHRNAIELWRLDLQSHALRQLTRGGAVNLQPRISPDGRQLAYVSTAGSGHFNLFVATLAEDELRGARTVVEPRQSEIARYYYSTHDHAINPAWTPDGKQLVFVSNREISYGTGNLCVVTLGSAAEPNCFVREETSWRANPEVAPDGRRVLYSSYQGRQWHQLWLTTLQGAAPLPLTFGEFDATQARWSADGRRIAYISNEAGNTSLWVHEVVGGRRERILVSERRSLQPMAHLNLELRSQTRGTVTGRISVVGSDGRAYARTDAWLHADDSFDPRVQSEETRYFHCAGRCVLEVPAGRTQVVAWHGQSHRAARQSIDLTTQREASMTLSLQELALPSWAPAAVSADLHVHMNYGGHYRHTSASLAAQASAEDLDVIYNTIVNKEQRIPDIAQFGAAPTQVGDALLIQAQEYHTSFWGHLGLLHLEQRYLTPDFSAYQHSALSSPYPHNGVIADLAREQGALVGYVHPFDWPIVPEREQSLTHALPADAMLGRVDYLEVVGFSDHRSTAEVWYKLLNLGLHIPAGAGTDAMANYASLRGPVGMNRVYLYTQGSNAPPALRDALKSGRTSASNGPLLALQLAGRSPGDVLNLPGGKHRLRYRAALRSLVPVERLEVVANGKVVATHRFGKDRTVADMQGDIDLSASGWVLLRAYGDGADPLIFDLYPYATTSPIYVKVAGSEARSPEDAAYFVRWLDRVIATTQSREDFNDAREKQATLAYLQEARGRYAVMAEAADR